MEALREVVGILDMDGFNINGKFLCKELGMLRIGDVYASSHFFDTGYSWSDLDERTRRQCHYVIRNIHRLPFGVPRGTRARRVTEIGDIVCDFYEQCRRDERSMLAYKGGHYERDLLLRLDVPCVDLERYGCPKARDLFGDLGWLETCGNHLTQEENTYEHCPKVEVEAFEHWRESVI